MTEKREKIINNAIESAKNIFEGVYKEAYIEGADRQDVYHLAEWKKAVDNAYVKGVDDCFKVMQEIAEIVPDDQFCEGTYLEDIVKHYTYEQILQRLKDYHNPEDQKPCPYVGISCPYHHDCVHCDIDHGIRNAEKINKNKRSEFQEKIRLTQRESQFLDQGITQC